jgi:hypothetical protein
MCALAANFFDPSELGGRGISALIGLVVGGLIAWLFARWRRLRERRNILRGDARDTVVIHHHILEPRADGPPVLRIRALGQSPLTHVVPNGHLGAILRARAESVTAHDTLISMEGAEGSYLLETLTGYVCDRTANASFEHDLFVMAPCCEPPALAQHQPITILLIAVADLGLFESWTTCRDVRVEHGSDGARVLSLMALARRHRVEQDRIAKLRQAGQRTRYVETMYILDLALDKRCAAVATREVPWGRFEAVLKQMNLDE